MTSREKNLLILFLLTLAAAGLVLGVSAYLDGISRLDSQYVSLQKMAVRVTQAASSSRDASSDVSLIRLKELFFAPGALGDPLTLATQVQAGLKSSGMLVLESRVMENTAASQWVQFHAEGDIQSWFRFLQALRRQDPRTLFRSLSLLRKPGAGYAITFEVGHAVLP